MIRTHILGLTHAWCELSQAKHAADHKTPSMKSRIKALTEEVCKKKGHHRRSTSYPVPNPPDENLLFHHKGKSLDCVGAPLEGCSDPYASTSRGRHIRLNYLKQNEVDHPVRDHTLVHGNLIYAIEPTRVDALHESKLFMDALNLLNVREEMFLNIMKDPSISMANQLHCRRSPNLRYGLNKSISFAHSGTTDFDDLEGWAATRRSHDVNKSREEIKQENQACEVLDNAASPAAAAATILRKKSDENRAGLMRFKNIREKIRYVIRDRKKEKNRIMMDALHHKVPYGTSPSKKLTEDGVQAGRSDFGKGSSKDYKRAASLDRYNQLLDISSGKEGKRNESKSSGVGRKPPTLGRILSLPDIRTHIPDIRFNEERALERVDSEDEGVTGHREQEEENDAGDEEARPSHVPSEVEQQEHEASPSEDSRSSKRHSSIEEEDDELIELDVEEGELDLDLDVDVYDRCMSAQDAVGIVQESQIKELYSELVQEQGDEKNNAEFNYVRGVLELSGFTRNESTLGKWRSGEYPLTPSVFEEVSDQQDSCCAPDQEDGISNQILLFDLINQVLLEIHERSFCYWPTRLTTRSSVHPLPKGSRVLEQVWAEIRGLLSSVPQSDTDMDDAVSRDLARDDGWMNLQLDAECVGLELEEIIFHDLLDEIF
ncbi:protein TRM32 [Salvia splendens]|uniref:protein TRM32 n=1 Tax=Salvia splendens TaxID=180675 RepID=UPI001C26411D|nr:protein TRM32 [Salvia splendens]